MERLTARGKKGRAYFDDDGVLIRGANGTFHQKKDMTAHYIHQRFVALDKAIDRLAAYEDTGLMPEEIMALLDSPNPPLTLDELRDLAGEPVWIECLFNENLSSYVVIDRCDNGIFTKLFYADFEYYNDEWLAYRRKPEVD